MVLLYSVASYRSREGVYLFWGRVPLEKNDQPQNFWTFFFKLILKNWGGLDYPRTLYQMPLEATRAIPTSTI